MQVLVADQLPPLFSEALAKKGIAVHADASLKGEGLADAIREIEPAIVVVRSTKVNLNALESARQLELVVRAGAGVDTIDVDAASARGIFVANCPGKNATAVAELTVGLMLSLDRRIPDNVLDARAGQWNKALYSKASGLRGRTLGLLGLGDIGTEVARVARSMGMKVIAWSRSLTDERAAEIGVQRAAHPIDVARGADIVSIHVAATPETRHLADRAFFDAMQANALFINTSRSSIVDEKALRWAMDEHGIRAAVDVLEGEPAVKEGTFEHELASHPSLYVTHHIGASTAQAQEAVAREALRIVVEYIESGHVPNCVNLAQHTPATHQLTVRHLDRVGVLAGVLDEMRSAGWNVQEMENLIFAGAEAACARIRFDGEVAQKSIDKISDLSDVLAVSLIDI